MSANLDAALEQFNLAIEHLRLAALLVKEEDYRKSIEMLIETVHQERKGLMECEQLYHRLMFPGKVGAA